MNWLVVETAILKAYCSLGLSSQASMFEPTKHAKLKDLDLYPDSAYKEVQIFTVPFSYPGKNTYCIKKKLKNNDN